MSDSNGARNVTTPRLGLNKPAVGADLDIWGDYLNSNCDTLDNSFLVTGGVFTGPVGGYPASTPQSPAFSVGSGAGIYAMGASMGVAAFNTNVASFSLSANTMAVPLNMTNNRIYNLANPTLGTDAVNLNTVASMGSAYLPVAGGQMLGPINMGGNLLTGLALPQNPADATSKQYVDALIADMRLFVDTWQVAANIPDISNISSITAGDYYIAVTANPSVPETAPSNIPGIAGLLINNGDMVIYSEATAQYELVRGGPLTVAEADALFVNKAGDTMSGGLSIVSTSGLSLRTPLGGVLGVNYDGFGALGANIAFGISAGVTYVYQNGLAVAGFVNLSGATMTGQLILSGNATQALGAVALQQVAGIYLPLDGSEPMTGALTTPGLTVTTATGITTTSLTATAAAGLVTNSITGRTAGTLGINGWTQTAASGVGGTMLVRGGDSGTTGGNGGVLNLLGGNCYSPAGNGGGVFLSTGGILSAGTATGTTGSLSASTANAAFTSTGASGNILFSTGVAYGRSSGQIAFQTGNGINGASSGRIIFTTGNVIDDPTGTATKGAIFFTGGSGGVFVDQDPTEPLGVATKQYVDALSITQAGIGFPYYGTHSFALAWSVADTALISYVDAGAVGYLIRSQGNPNYYAAYELAVSTGGAGTVWWAGGGVGTWALAPIADRKSRRNVAPASIDALDVVNRLGVYQADITLPWGEAAKSEHWDCSFMGDEVQALVPAGFIPAANEKAYDSLRDLPLLATLWRAVQQISERLNAIEGGL